MPVTFQQDESRCLIKLEGQVTLTSAAELKTLLLEWLAARKGLEMDLVGTEEIDITILQLLWAATREATGRGVGIVWRVSNAAAAAARDAGFDDMPGFSFQA
ncbi:MAG: STAS domain-containing protein [Bryobacteraceae bacterium]|jgi:anti-anti-sigma regulatory factor